MKVVMDNWLKKGAKTASDTMEIAKKAHSYRARKSKNLSQVRVTNEALTSNEESTDLKYGNSDLIDYKNSTPYQYLLILNKGDEPFSKHVKAASSFLLRMICSVALQKMILRN